MRYDGIIFKCKHKLGDLAMVEPTPAGIVLRRGDMRDNHFQTHDSERLPYGTNPELEGIYDPHDQAWDLDKLFALLHDCCEELRA